MKYAVLAFSVLFASAAFAAGPKSYQVTGPVVDVRPDAIVVEKDKSNWEIAADAAMTKDIKKGDKVTVEYTMAAKKVTKK